MKKNLVISLIIIFVIIVVIFCYFSFFKQSDEQKEIVLNSLTGTIYNITDNDIVLKDINKTILTTKLKIVILYFFLFLLIFLNANSPSIPNNFWTNLLVLTFLLESLISSFNLIASIGLILLALLLGKYAEIIIVIII